MLLSFVSILIFIFILYLHVGVGKFKHNDFDKLQTGQLKFILFPGLTKDEALSLIAIVHPTELERLLKFCADARFQCGASLVHDLITALRHG